MKGETTFCSKGGCAQGKGLLVIGGPEQFHISYKKGYKSHKNRELRQLNGLVGTMRKNKAGTCKVLEVGIGTQTIHVGTLSELPFTKKELSGDMTKVWSCYDTNGGGNAPLIITCQ